MYIYGFLKKDKVPHCTFAFYCVRYIKTHIWLEGITEAIIIHNDQDPDKEFPIHHWDLTYLKAQHCDLHSSNCDLVYRTVVWLIWKHSTVICTALTVTLYTALWYDLFESFGQQPDAPEGCFLFLLTEVRIGQWSRNRQPGSDVDGPAEVSGCQC